jgi:hypothetical protein
MATKDYDKHYVALRTQVPNTVSRNVKVGERSFQTVVYEAGKPVLDAELQLNQDAGQWSDSLLRAWQAPTGWLKGQSHTDSFNDYIFVDGAGVVDNGPDHELDNDNTLKRGILNPAENPFTSTMVNAFLLPRLELMVAGRPVVVEYTNTETNNRNLILLDPPSVFDGSTNFKRTDFVFLECWLSLVAPSPRASGYVQILDAGLLVPGDKVTIEGNDLIAGLNWTIDPLSETNTATNLAAAINTAPLNSIVFATSALGKVTINAVARGTVGNAITLAVTVTDPASILLSGPTLINGADRPDKPPDAQNKLYRHGNVLSPAATWLDDELEDPRLDAESTQRVQLQYRIRVTGETIGVDYKSYPDGFSSQNAGPNTIIYAQGSTASPVVGYPFVPADTTSVWNNSSAVAYGREDTGLWVAGDGSSASAQALGSVDGYVYAVPVCFVFRHNDVSSSEYSIGGVKGFDPTNNANGAPLYPHEEYEGILGTIPANDSDRPDNEFANVITDTRVMDLRRHVAFPGIDYNGELKYQIQSLLDGNFRTWQFDTNDKQPLGGTSSGDVSTRFLICNEVGRGTLPPPMGEHPIMESEGNGVLVRNFDHVARRFGSQPVIERLVLAFSPTDIEGFIPGKYVTKAGLSAGTWQEGDTLNLNLNLFNATTLGTIFQGADGGGPTWVDGTFHYFAPEGTVITDILSITHDDGSYASAIDQNVQTTLIEGLGTQYVSIQLDSNPLVADGGVATPVSTYPMVGTSPITGSPRRIFVEFEITYPLGVGLTDTPTVLLEPNPAVYTGTRTSLIPVPGAGPGALIENDVTQRPADMETVLAPDYREGFKEVHLEYLVDFTTIHSNPQPGVPVTDTIVSYNATTLYPPRRMFGDVSRPISVNDISSGAPVAKTVDTTLTEYGSSTRKLKIINDLIPMASQSLCTVEYFAQDPIPNYGAAGSGGYQVSAYFRANAPQTAGVMAGVLGTPDGISPNPLVVEPLTMGDVVWSGQTGDGSVESAFPYVRPLAPIPAIYYDEEIGPDPQPVPEWLFCATANITVTDFNAETGLLTLQSYVQGDLQENLSMGSITSTQPFADSEWRSCYTVLDPDSYHPTVMAPPLYGANLHKVFVPILARITSDPQPTSKGLMFRKNELVLVVLSRFAFLNNENKIIFTEINNNTCAAVYRTRNLLMVVGDRS